MVASRPKDLEFCRAFVHNQLVDLDGLAARLDDVPDLDPRARSAVDARLHDVKRYLAQIGTRGGRKSRRTLSSEDARAMVKVREARRAFRKFRARCFWSYRPDLHIGLEDVPWVAERLMKRGDREAWRVGAKLCR